MIFTYMPLPTRRPVPSLGGAMLRYRPIVPVGVSGPLGLRFVDSCVDCGSDDTIFPLSLARKLGIDLAGAPRGESHPVGGAIVPYLYAAVTLRVSDGVETCEWQATVGFVDLPLRWALLGHAGFLDFFDTDLRGARHEVFLTPSSAFAGTHAIRPTCSP